MIHSLPDEQKFDDLVARMADALGRHGPDRADGASVLSSAFRFMGEEYLDGIMERYGDTYTGMSAASYIKQLEAEDFVPFADYPLGRKGRTMAFLRERNCLLGLLSFEPDTAPELSVTGRAVEGTTLYPYKGFVSEITNVGRPSMRGFRYRIDGTSGLGLKCHLLDRRGPFAHAWWGLDEDRREVSDDVGSDLVGRRDRARSVDYNDIRDMVSRRRDGIPARYRFHLDADRRFTITDVLERK